MGTADLSFWPEFLGTVLVVLELLGTVLGGGIGLPRGAVSVLLSLDESVVKTIRVGWLGVTLLAVALSVVVAFLVALGFCGWVRPVVD